MTIKLSPKDQAGSMSLLTVVFLALLLTIVTVSFIRLAVTEQRQSTDDDLTTRAFYAAESGIEDAKRALAIFESGGSVNLNGDVCDPADVVPNGVLSTDLDTEYTCQLINVGLSDFQAELEAWEAVTIPLDSGGAPFNRIKIQWHIEDDGLYSRHTTKDLPSQTVWTANHYPAMLRSAVFWHSSSGSFTPTLISQQHDVFFLNPSNTTETAAMGTNDGQVINAQCDDPTISGKHACSINITGLSSSGQTYYLRLQALYVGTDVRVTLLDSSGREVLLDGVQAVIDVTGRAGDVYRRLEARVPLTQYEYPLPDIALWSNTDICKDLTVTDDPNEAVKDCPWAP